MFSALANLPLTPGAPAAEPSSLALLPAPAHVRLGSGRLAFTRDFRVAFTGWRGSRIEAALERVLRRWEERTGYTLARTPDGAYPFSGDPTTATLVIACAADSEVVPQLGEDESYTLAVTTVQMILHAPTVLGAQRGLQTLLQLLQGDEEGWFLPEITIRDRPRFPWRGLMIDVCRHWQPIEVIKRNLDGMELVKLNVLHLHLSEDQGFRLESKVHPRLHELGSDGDYFTQAQMREIISYASERGIRVVPEFDLPGHAQSWLVGYPELASRPGPYTIERRWGIFDAVLDPTNEATYVFLEPFLAEMAALFPDPHFHIGGDENNGVQWSASSKIQSFIRTHHLHDNEGLQAHFNRRVAAILAQHGKKLIGWDEILHPDLPKTALIQSWRGAAGLAAAANQGHAVILSNGYYIDLGQPAAQHYVNDPLPETTPLSQEEQTRILGGEATMWSEWTTSETIDSRIWPRAAAIAERLWSPREVVDLDELYRRLAIVSRRLTEAGLRHESYREPMLSRYAGDRAGPGDLATLRELVGLLQPAQGYQRGKYQPDHTQFTPLTGLADCAAPDSAAARDFARAVDAVIFGDASAETLRPFIAAWNKLATAVAAASPRLGPASAELNALAQQLADSATLASEIVEQHIAEQAPTRAWFMATLTALTAAGEPRAAAQLPIITPLQLLAASAHEHSRRTGFSMQAWHAHLHELVSPIQP